MPGRIQSDPFRMSFPRAAPGKLPASFQLILGLWLFVSGSLWDQPAGARLSSFLVGAGIAGASIAAMSNDRARFINTALAAWAAFSSAVLFRIEGIAQVNALLVAGAVFLLSLVPPPAQRGQAPDQRGRTS